MFCLNLHYYLMSGFGLIMFGLVTGGSFVFDVALLVYLSLVVMFYVINDLNSGTGGSFTVVDTSEEDEARLPCIDCIASILTDCPAPLVPRVSELAASE